MTKKSKGSIIIPAGLDIWEHELRTAQTLARNGYTVQFLAAEQGYRKKTADVLMDNETYEMKSPKADKLSAIERNLKRAARQSCNLIIDSQRTSKIHDATIQKFLVQKTQAAENHQETQVIHKAWVVCSFFLYFL